MNTPTTPTTLSRRTFTWLLAAGGLAALAAPTATAGPDPGPPPPATDRLTVHEWGTFTVLQDEQGEPIGGINTDDEPVPDFCHDIAGLLTPGESEIPPVYFKAIPRSHPDVWVRLETPVVYFYPPKGFTGPVHLAVSFRGGWLTQFYPDAAPAGPAVNADGYLEYGPLSDSTHGSLLWKGLKLDGTEPGPKTDNKAWLAPRNVPAAASVTTPKGERERYVFYRGVGHARAPLRVVRDGSTLRVRGQWGKVPRPAGQSTIGPLWLFDARPDGTCAFRTIEYVDLSNGDDGRTLAETPAHFEPSEYSRDNLPLVRRALHAGLVRDGMYADEAEALLNTWEASYFKRPGLRLFFMVPRVWTDHHLPLTVSTDSERLGTDVERAMIGRIELVTPGQRELLRRIAAGPTSSPEWAQRAWERMRGSPQDLHREEWYQRVTEGRSTVLEELGLAVPADYRTYLALGRFRNALLNDELRRRPTEALQEFVKRYHLEEYKPGRD